MIRTLPIAALRRAGVAAVAVSAVAAVSTALAPAASATPGCSPTPGVDFSVPVPAGPPALADVIDADGAHDVSVSILGSDAQFYDYFARFGLDSDLVGSLECVQGGQGVDKPGTVLTSQGMVNFESRADGTVWERDLLVGSSGAWTQVPGARTNSGVDAVASGGNIDLFYISADPSRAILHQQKTNGVWTTPESLGGASNEVPSVTVGADGRLHVWVTGTDDKIYVKSGFLGSWTGWQVLSSGLSAHAPAAMVGYGDPSREDVFVTGLNGFLYQTTLTNLGGFTGWHRIMFMGTDARLDASSQGNGHAVVMWSGGGQTLFAQFITGHKVWMGPFLPTYLCDDCLPTATASTTAVAPAVVSQGAHAGVASHRTAAQHD